MTNPVVDALLPPAILAVLTAALLAIGHRRWAIATLAALVLLSVESVPHVLISPLLRFKETAEKAPPGAIVVLASGMPEFLDTSRTVPGMETLKSLRTAAAVHRRTGLPILVSGASDPVGDAPDSDAPVADGMATSLSEDFDAPVTWRETASTNVWQSGVAVAGLLRGAGIDGIYLVGQPWELRLRVAVFRAAGLRVTPESVPYRRQRTLDLTGLIAFTPAWLESAIAIRQWAGLACQAMPLCVAWMRGPAATPGPS